MNPAAVFTIHWLLLKSADKVCTHATQYWYLSYMYCCIFQMHWFFLIFRITIYWVVRKSCHPFVILIFYSDDLLDVWQSQWKWINWIQYISFVLLYDLFFYWSHYFLAASDKTFGAPCTPFLKRINRNWRC